MILVDTGPLVSLFDPADSAHGSCVQVLKTIGEPIATTVPVLTEAFHLLQPNSIATERLMDFVAAGGLVVLFLDTRSLLRVFELMAQYSDVPMDLADASLVSMAENHNLQTVFTIDRKDFFVYRVKRGHRSVAFQVIGVATDSA